MVRLDGARFLGGRGPWWIVGVWAALAAFVGLCAPDLTRLAAEGQARMLAADAESRQAALLLNHCWPEQAYSSMAAALLYRPGGLTDEDRRYAADLAQRIGGDQAPADVLRVLGPNSAPETAARLVSADHTAQLVVVALSSSFVAPGAHETVAWLEKQTVEPGVPAGLQARWTGDAVIGREYMKNVQTSLDRAAVATVLLLLVVLLIVYRSIWLALVPLVTIGASLIVARGVLAWMMLLGWDLSPLVELFLIAVLFGTGTDFCLFLSWRYAERLNPENPVASMRVTLSRSTKPLATSAGTIIVGLLLMGTTRFKLFSSTGPSVAIALALALVATLTLTPALLVLLARARPGAFKGLAGGSRELWERIGRLAMARPLRSWALTILAMLPLSILGMRTHFIQDLLAELPANSPATVDFRLTAAKFDPGMLAPLTVVLESDVDLRRSEGLAMIDDVSRLLSHQRMLSEVRSATQPLGSAEPLERARLASRLGVVDQGFVQIEAGAGELQKGLSEGAAKLRAALWLEKQTGLSLTGAKPAAKQDSGVARASGDDGKGAGTESARAMAGLGEMGAAAVGLPGLGRALSSLAVPAPAASSASAKDAKPAGEKPPETMLRDLGRAVQGVGRIAAGAARAHREMTAILTDPVGRRALDRLLINDQTVDENPELLRGFHAYITADGRRARIDLTQTDRLFSHAAMDQVLTLRRRLTDYLGEYEGVRVTARIAGANAESADIRALTTADQMQSWIIVPLGVFLVLLAAIRDPLACANLVATMILTYAFALGATHIVFVTVLGAEGLDWKTPYFLFVLLVAVGVDYNVFLMTRLSEESRKRGLREGIILAISHTGGLITSAAAITACSFASFLTSPLGSLRQLGFALAVGILVDAVLVRPVLAPCGHWLLRRTREVLSPRIKIKRGLREYVVISD